MLSIFKDQQPGGLIALVVLMLVTRLPFLILGIPLPGDVSNITEQFPDFLILILSSLLIFIQAIWINYIFSEAQIFDQRSFVPAAVWILITLLDKGFFVPGQPMAIGFVFTALTHSLMDIRQQEASAKQCFNSGFLLGIAIAFHPPFLVFLPFLILSLFNLKAFGPREYMIGLLGVFTPMIWAWSILYIFGKDFNWIQELMNTFQFIHLEYNFYLFLSIGTILAYSLGGVAAMLNIVQSAGFKRKKNVRTLLYLSAGVVLVFVLSNNWVFANSYFVLIPLSMLISTLLLRINKKLLAELLFGIFAIGLLVIQILSSVI